MNKAQELMDAVNESKRKRFLLQYSEQGNTLAPIGKTKSILEAGVYQIVPTMQGLEFEKLDMKADELLRFEDPVHDKILNEISDFWKKKEKFSNLGFTHKRGILMFGLPGSGKTSIVKLVTESVVKNGDVVFICKRNPSILTEGLKTFREVEPDRRALVIMEDVDTIVRYDEHSLLELLSGNSQVDNILYLGTTNYIDRLPERALRPDRFDRKIEVPHPPSSGRKAYLQSKLDFVENTKFDVEELVKKTDGFSFAQLKEFLISVLCHDYDVDKTINRIRNGVEFNECANFSESMINFKLKREGIKKKTKVQQLNDNLDVDTSFTEIDPMNVALEFEKVLRAKDIDGIQVDGVDVGLDGIINVGFSDEDGDEMEVAFMYDEEEDSFIGLVVDDDAGQNDFDVFMIDITAMNPSAIEVEGIGKYVNLIDLSWMNKSVLMSIFKAGDIGDEETEAAAKRLKKRQDAFGNVMTQDLGTLESMDERAITVVRGGKKVRLPVVRKTKRKRLTAKQKAGIRKGAMKRKQKSAQTQRKRKKSLNIRKRSNIKNTKLGKRQRVKR